jgi:hypothetical protein
VGVPVCVVRVSVREQVGPVLFLQQAFHPQHVLRVPTSACEERAKIKRMHCGKFKVTFRKLERRVDVDKFR